MNTDWEKHGICREIGPELFEPDDYSPPAVAEAKDACGRCMVQALCLDAAMREEAGQPRELRATVRGGLTPRERWQLDRQQREAA